MAKIRSRIPLSQGNARGGMPQYNVLLERAQLSLEAPPWDLETAQTHTPGGNLRQRAPVYTFCIGSSYKLHFMSFLTKILDITFSRHPTSGARSALLSTHRFAGGLYSTIIVDEGTWMVEVSGLLHIELVKEKTKSLSGGHAYSLMTRRKIG